MNTNRTGLSRERLNTTHLNRACAQMLALLSILSAHAARAADWYTSPTGTGSGTTAASPTQPQYAAIKASSGDRIILSPGLYALGSSYGLGISNFGKDLFFQGLPGATILDMTFVGISLPYGGTVKMENIIFQNGIYSLEASKGTHLEIRSSTFNNLTVRAMLISDATAFIENCLFYNNGLGIVTSGIADIEVLNSTFKNNVSTALDLLSPGSSTRIVGSNFDANRIGIEISSISRGNTQSLVEGNHFIGNQWGVVLQSGLAGYAYVASDQISHNTFFGSTTAAIYSGTGHNIAMINGNWIENNARGIYLDKTGDTLINNVVFNTYGGGGGGNGLQVNNGTARVAFNTIAYNAIDGIRATAADASIYANNISYKNWGAGLRIMASPAAQVGYNDTFLNVGPNLAGVFVSLGGHKFVSPGFVGATDFHLIVGSPMIGAANWALVPVTEDYDGKFRAAGAADVGAFEY